MSADRFADIRARLAASTPGPWKHIAYRERGFEGESVRDDAGHEIVNGEGCFFPVDEKANLSFIANAPSDIGRLLAEVDRLREALTDLAGSLYVPEIARYKARAALAPEEGDG